MIMRQMHIYAALVMMLLCGCSKEIPVEDISYEESDCAIKVVPVMDSEKAATRASLYNNESDLRGDYLYTYAYREGTSLLYFGSGVKFSTEDVDISNHRWLFYGDGGYKKFYWPLEGALDFFAYAPSNNGYVQVNPAANPPQFTADMPLTNTGETVHQENMKEFLYSYAPDRDKTGGTVPLAFRHPFAGIVFKGSQSHRDLTVKSITIDGIKYKGTCSLDSETGATNWSLTESAGKLDLNIGKIIPGDVNFYSELCGPYLVLPQSNDGTEENKILSVTCHWKGYNPNSDAESDDTKTLTGKISNDWEAGKIYTYTLDLGNSREEILFKVSVAPWKYVYNHEFEIE